MTRSRSGAPPDDVLEGALAALGAEGERVAWSPVGGGSIHPAVRLSVGTEASVRAFLKWAEAPGLAGFGVEARGLGALERSVDPAAALRIPRVLAFDEGEAERRGWLLLEWLEPAPPGPGTAARLGAGLAALHASLRSTHPRPAPGWDEPGWIGPLPQDNRPASGTVPAGGTGPSWPDFWWERRILGPIEALPPGRLPGALRRRIEGLGLRIHDHLAGWEVDGLSLLHGDLWSGNVVVTGDGTPALVDPAVYRGHREVDLAMMRLFGGFGTEVLEAYRGRWPSPPGFEKLREPWYRLYPLLVHLHLFGTGYLSGIDAAVSRLERI